MATVNEKNDKKRNGFAFSKALDEYKKQKCAFKQAEAYLFSLFKSRRHNR